MKWLSLGKFMALLVLAGCQTGDSKMLGGPYYLSAGDPQHVYIWKEMGIQNEVVIEQQVVDFEVLKGYLLVRRKVAKSVDCYDRNNVPTIVTHYTDEDEYWVIDLNEETETGPLKEQSYLGLLKNIGLPPVDLTVPSTYIPNTEIFNNWVKDCTRLVRK